MQNRYSLLIVVASMLTFSAKAQTTYLPLWSKEAWLLDRMEIRLQKNVDLNLSTLKPYIRKAYVELGDSLLQLHQKGELPGIFTPVDAYNLNRMLANSSEYSSKAGTAVPAWKSKKPLGKGFFETPANMLEVNKPSFYLAINPAVAVQHGVESDFDDAVYFRSFGASARGLIGKSVAFNFQATFNDEMGPLAYRQFVARNQAIPGATNFTAKSNGTGFTYADIRGSLNFKVTKYINIQAGRDQQFIGNGYRSLMLSNFSAPHNFVKLNTRIWKLNYTNLFMQLNNAADVNFNKQVTPKYASMHHLSVNATKWLTLGVFEGIIFGRSKHYDFSYLQPMIFLRSMEQQNGSPDNANIGADVKVNIAGRGQFYAALMLDEFKKDELVGARRFWWGNKQAIQAGFKYINAFGIKNLDLQGEFNQIRPYMYQFRDTAGSYAHALQPLAHPLGANLREFAGILRYQPFNKLYINARVIYWKQGLDSAGFNMGANPNDNYNPAGQGGTRPPRENFFPLFVGKAAQGLNASLHVSYELKENMFFELSGMYRIFDEADKASVSTSLISAGFRWNMFRREYDY